VQSFLDGGSHERNAGLCAVRVYRDSTLPDGLARRRTLVRIRKVPDHGARTRLFASGNAHWTLAGGSPTIRGAMRIYSGTWTVTGGGSLTRTQGAQTLTAQWTTNASLSNAPIAIFVRASDGRLIIKSWHSQLRVPRGVTGVQQVTINSVAQTPGAISVEAFEWQFPAVDDVSTSKNLSRSSTAATNGAVGPMQPGGSQGTAACSWRFAYGPSSPAKRHSGP